MTEQKNILDQEKCIKCQLCIEVCPCNILGINSNHEVHFIKKRESICLQCGQCMAICSTKAIQVQGISHESDLFDLPENDINHKSFIDFLSNRRSVRNFKDKPVPRELIAKIIDSIAFEAIMSLIIGYPKYKYNRAIKRDVQHLKWIE